ncbi:hypothetical protein ACI789_21710 [Geodermatophilus sp. SYSU D00965]
MSTSVVVAVGFVLLFLVGGPLFAWWLGRRRFWERQSGLLEPHVSRELAARHGLRPTEFALVDRAATWGREVSDDRLRAAVVDLATQKVGAASRRPAPRPWLVVLAVVWGAAIAGVVVFAVAQGRWGDVNWVTAAWWGVLAVVGNRWRTGPERAIRRNGPRLDPPGRIDP